MHENHVEAGERWESGACHQCFQYLILICQLLVYPLIGQFQQFMSTTSIAWLHTSRAKEKT